jgi:hypothetical protein
LEEGALQHANELANHHCNFTGSKPRFCCRRLGFRGAPRVSPLGWKPRPHPDNVAEVLGLGFGQALATEAIAECIRSGGVGEAESNIGLLCLVPTPAAADWDAPFTMERINLLENTAKASRRKCEFD